MSAKHLRTTESAGLASGGSDSPLLWSGSKVLLCIVGLCMTALRLALAVHIPVEPALAEQCDDRLLVDYAQTLVAGNWLGDYGWLTLAKRPGYAFLLALPSLTGFSYQALFIGLHALACLAFVLAVRRLWDSDLVSLLVYLAMLYLPALFTWELFQRVYRMGIVIPFVVLLFSCYIAMYLRRDESIGRLVPWSVIAGLAAPVFYLIKEDGLWVAPFVGVVLAILAGGWIRGVVRRRLGVWSAAGRLLVALLPLCCVAAAVVAVQQVNYDRYGERTICERSDSTLSEAFGLLVSIDAPGCDHVTWVSRDALDAALAASPTLNLMRDDLLAAWDQWGGGGEVPGDHACWALMSAYDRGSRYVSGAQTEHYWGAVADELRAGFDAGRLAKKEGLKISSGVQPIVIADVGWWMHDTIGNMRMLWMLERARLVEGMGGVPVEEGPAMTELLRGRVAIAGQDSASEPSVAWAMGTSRSWVELCRTAALPLALLTAAGVMALIYGAAIKRLRPLGETLLVMLGLGLSGFELVAAVTWFTSFLGDISEWAAYMYCASFYALAAMFCALAIGVGGSWLAKTCRLTIREDTSVKSDGAASLARISLP